MTITNITLMKVAAIGGMITCSTGMLLQRKVKNRIRDTEYYREAFRILRADAAARRLLGEPIKEIGLNISDSDKAYCDKLVARFAVPVKGPIQRGTLFFWAARPTPEHAWDIERMELGLKNEPDRRLLIKVHMKVDKST